jgi:hypothetical protein
MPELMREPVGLPRISKRGGGDHTVVPKHKPMLAVIGFVLGVLLQGCAAGKHPSGEENRPGQCG